MGGQFGGQVGVGVQQDVSTFPPVILVQLSVQRWHPRVDEPVEVVHPGNIEMVPIINPSSSSIPCLLARVYQASIREIPVANARISLNETITIIGYVISGPYVSDTRRYARSIAAR